MKNEDMKKEVQLLKQGKYRFIVTNVLSNNKEGTPLKTKDGSAFKKLKVAILNSQNEVFFIYEPIFSNNQEKVQHIVNSINNEWLTKKWQAGTFEPRDLIGMGGACIVTVQKGKEDYQNENNIECFIHQDCDFFTPFFGEKGD